MAFSGDNAKTMDATTRRYLTWGLTGMDLGAYLSGYADGEGCFCVTFNRSRRHRFGWDIRPSFSVSQNRDRAQVLDLFHETLRCGKIRADRSDKTLKYEVRSAPELVSRVVPHFRRHPLLSAKRSDFEVFAEICEIMGRGEHLTREGFERIATLASRINPAGKKRYPRIEIKV